MSPKARRKAHKRIARINKRPCTVFHPDGTVLVHLNGGVL